MFCPNCLYEYKPGVVKCPDCGADLVNALPSKPSLAPKGPEVSTGAEIVFESEIGADIAIAKEILDEADIPYIEGRSPTAHYGEHKRAVQVSGADAERAKSLLADLIEGGSRLAEDVDIEAGADFPETLVSVFEPVSQSELSAARSILNKAGIDYEVVDNRSLSGETSVEIQVVQAQADEARALLRSIRKQ